MSTNPFTFGNPILDPRRFHGRGKEIRQMVNRLLSSAHESTSVIGERRIGKTSLLSYLSHPEVAQSLGLTPDHYCLVYVDLQGLTDITPQRFWQRVLKRIAQRACLPELKAAAEKLANQPSFDLFDLEDLFETAQRDGYTTVLFMDEFEYVTQNPNFNADFFGGLRALAIHHGLTLIPATRRELVDLCHSNEIKGSPFFNIFANIVLRPFERSEVDELLEAYSLDSPYTIAPDERDFVWRMAGGYPIFVQMAGYYLVEGKEQGLSGESLTRFVTASFDQQADAHYTYLWGRCSENEKITLLTLLTLGLQKSGKKTIPSAENLRRIRPRALQDLEAMSKRGLVEEDEGLYRLFSESFGRWIQHEIAAEPDQKETTVTAAEWLAAGGRQDLQETKGVLPRFKKKYWGLLATVAKELSFEFAAAGVVELLKILL